MAESFQFKRIRYSNIVSVSTLWFFSRLNYQWTFRWSINRLESTKKENWNETQRLRVQREFVNKNYYIYFTNQWCRCLPSYAALLACVCAKKRQRKMIKFTPDSYIVFFLNYFLNNNCTTHLAIVISYLKSKIMHMTDSLPAFLSRIFQKNLDCK